MSLTLMPEPVRHPQPDLEVRRLMLQLSLTRLGDMSKLSVAAARRNWQLALKAFASREPVSDVSSAHVECGSHSIELRVYRGSPKPTPPSAPPPVLLWCHGGGFVLGDLYTAGATCRAIARRTGAVVVAVRYRLAPEHSLDDAYQDCLAALRWIEEKADDIGVDRERIAIGGDSAGGALATRVAQADLGRRLVKLQLLVYPATDMSRDHTQSSLEVPLLTHAHVAWLRRHMARRSDLNDPQLSPLLSSNLAGLAPALVVTSGFDPLCDEGLVYAQRMADAAVPVRVIHYPGQFHGFLCFDLVLVGARDALDRIGSAISGHFADTPLSTGVDSVSISTADSLRDLRWVAPSQLWNGLEAGLLFARDRLNEWVAGDQQPGPRNPDPKRRRRNGIL